MSRKIKPQNVKSESETATVPVDDKMGNALH